jgi:hypothetical protein
MAHVRQWQVVESALSDSEAGVRDKANAPSMESP